MDSVKIVASFLLINSKSIRKQMSHPNSYAQKSYFANSFSHIWSTNKQISTIIHRFFRYWYLLFQINACNCDVYVRWWCFSGEISMFCLFKWNNHSITIVTVFLTRFSLFIAVVGVGAVINTSQTMNRIHKIGTHRRFNVL